MIGRGIIVAGALLGLALGSEARATVETIYGSHTIVWSKANLVYASWSEAEGARPGARAVVVPDAAGRASGAVPETLEVVWARDAIAALRPLHGTTTAGPGAALVPI